MIAAVAGAQIVVSSYRRQFIAGRKSWLEVLNAVREHSQYQAQLVDTRASIIAAYYKLQVDFGMMSWQQFNQSRQPEPVFHPLDPVKKWLNGQHVAQQTSNRAVIQPVGMKNQEMVTYSIKDPSDGVANTISNDPDMSDTNTGLLADKQPLSLSQSVYE